MLSHVWDNVWSSLYFNLFRPMIKWLLRKVTGKCELLRITYGEAEGCCRTKAIESSLRHSRQPHLKQILVDDNVDIPDAVDKTMQIKQILPEVHMTFADTFKSCLCHICSYKRLYVDLETLRKVPYSSDNDSHESMLLEVWQNLMPSTTLESRISRQWGDIGFQGDDPQTDFRGMGMLGLHQLAYFCSKHTDCARSLLSHSLHPKYGYSFAIVGINLTGIVHSLMKSGYLKTHFYNGTVDQYQLDDAHQVFCYIFYEFDRFWFGEKPKDIMEFGRLRDKFHRKLKDKLRKDKTVFATDFQIQNETDVDS